MDIPLQQRRASGQEYLVPFVPTSTIAKTKQIHFYYDSCVCKTGLHKGPVMVGSILESLTAQGFGRRRPTSTVISRGV